MKQYLWSLNIVSAVMGVLLFIITSQAPFLVVTALNLQAMVALHNG